MTGKRWLWVGFVGLLFAVHLLIGTLAAIATAFYWLLEKRASPHAPETRCDETLGVQLAFRQAVQRVFKDAGSTYQLPERRMIGREWLTNLPTVSSDTWNTLGITPAHYKQLTNAGTLLAAAGRITSDPIHEKIVIIMLDPIGKTPVTQDQADGMEEVIEKTFLRSIVPAK